jgi:hypothetical protein
MRKAGELPDAEPQLVSDDQIARHKDELTDLANRYMSDEISFDRYNKEVKERGWLHGAQSPWRAWPSERRSRFEFNPKEGGKVMMDDIRKNFEVMKQVGQGVIYLLDPRGGQHQIQVGNGGDQK